MKTGERFAVNGQVKRSKVPNKNKINKTKKMKKKYKRFLNQIMRYKLNSKQIDFLNPVKREEMPHLSRNNAQQRMHYTDRDTFNKVKKKKKNICFSLQIK